MIRTAAAACPRVLIVGAGLAGTATAIRLLCFARGPLEIVLLERRSDYRSAGVAYHRDGNPWDHVFNIQAGRMSLFREDVLDFVRWANLEADRRGWPAPWATLEFTEQGPAPRRILQDYLADRLAEARREASAGVVLVEEDCEAVDIRVGEGGVEVTVTGTACQAPAHGEGDAGASGDEGDADAARDADEEGDASAAGVGQAERRERVRGTAVLVADHVVLATGLELRDAPFAAEVGEHPSYLRNPYSASGVRKLEELAPDATVAIVGSVLSAYDSAAFLLRQGHTGTIHLISRTGTIFRTYPEGHEHAVAQLPCPKTLLEPFRNREELLDRVRGEWDAACAILAREHPAMDPAVVAERVTKAWEPYLPEALEQIPSPVLRGLLSEFSTLIAALRVCAVEYTMSVIREAMSPADGSVKLVVGEVREITPTDSDRLLVSVGGPGPERVIEADLVVSNFGRETDYSRPVQPLWTSLLRQGLAVPHARTGRGVEVDEHGTLCGSGAKAVSRLSAVGPPREGDEIVRNGRTGAFAFNLAAIKNQSIAVAARVLERLELHVDDPARFPAEHDGYVGNVEQAARDGFDQAVVLEVRRLAMRTRSERETLDSRLDERIGSIIGSLHPRPLDASQRDRLLRTLVNRAAVARLTDVSVTPRQLRRQLGLADAEDPEA